MLLINCTFVVYWIIDNPFHCCLSIAGNFCRYLSAGKGQQRRKIERTKLMEEKNPFFGGTNL